MRFVLYIWKYIQPMLQGLLRDFQAIQTILSDSEFRKRKIRDNLYACSFVASLLCLLSITGFVGTYAPKAAGAILPVINSTAVYLSIFLINLVFLVSFCQCLRGVVKDIELLDDLVYAFLFIDSSLACLSFFTTQDGSSFFFEYLLILILIYLLPIYDNVRVLVSVIAINLVTTFAVISLTGHEIAWQDQYDIVLFYLICLVIIFSRRHLALSFARIRMNLRSSNELFHQRSRTDVLTGLLNREALREDFEQYLGNPVCTMICDIDKFKFFNDTYGHGQGDKILSGISHTFSRVFQDDFIYRYGGDEFLVLSFKNQPAFQKDVERFRQALKKQHFAGLDRQPTISGGYTWGLCTSADELRKMFALADQFLYQAKESGRNRVHYEIFDSGKAEKGLHEIRAQLDKSS